MVWRQSSAKLQGMKQGRRVRQHPCRANPASPADLQPQGPPSASTAWPACLPCLPSPSGARWSGLTAQSPARVMAASFTRYTTPSASAGPAPSPLLGRSRTMSCGDSLCGGSGWEPPPCSKRRGGGGGRGGGWVRRGSSAAEASVWHLRTRCCLVLACPALQASSTAFLSVLPAPLHHCPPHKHAGSSGSACSPASLTPGLPCC